MPKYGPSSSTIESLWKSTFDENYEQKPPTHSAQFNFRPHVLNHPYSWNIEYECMAWLARTIGEYRDGTFAVKELNSIAAHIVDEDNGFFDPTGMILFLQKKEKEWRKFRKTATGHQIAECIFLVLTDTRFITDEMPVYTGEKDKHWFDIRSQSGMTVNKKLRKSKGSTVLARSTPPPLGDNALF